MLRLQGQLARGDVPKLADWLTTVELMTMYEQYFSKEENEQLQRHALAAQDDIDARWPALMLAVRRLMGDRVASEHPSAQARAREWTELLERRVGGDPTLLDFVRRAMVASPS